MKIEVMGPGCARCHATEQNVRKALAGLGAEAEVAHVYDVKEYAKRGVLLTPAVAIDGNVVIQGRIPEVAEVTSLVATALARPS